MKETIKNVIYGLAIGDAIGVPVEFLYRDDVRKVNIQKMEGVDTNFKYKEFSRWGDITPKGCYSDDTAMALASMDAYCTDYKNDKELLKTTMENFITWWNTGKYSSLTYPFGLGSCCNKSMEKYKKTKDVYNCGCTNIKDNGNGAMMRISPTCLDLYYSNISLDEKIRKLRASVSLTHAHPFNQMANVIYFLFFSKLIDTNDKYNAFNYIVNFDYSRYFDGDTIKVFDSILNEHFLDIVDIEEKTNGYVVDTLEGVLFSIMNNNNFKDSILCAVNLGYDTDTIAGITGTLAGALYGYENIPKDWVKDLRKKHYLDTMINKFYNKLRKEKDGRIMKKVFIIKWEELYSNGEYSSGVSYVFDTLEKAKNMLQTIKKDDLEIYMKDENYEKEDILKEDETSIMFDFLDKYDEYIKYEIIEEEVK